jgi:hypothetical protein
VVAAGLALSVVSALVLIPAIVDPVHATAPVLRDSNTADLTPVPAALDLEHTHGPMAYPSCLGKPPSACTLVKGTGRRVLLIGDSHASMLIPLFTEIAHLENLQLSASVLLGCPWQRNLTTSYFHKRCQRQKADLYTRVVPALRPDIIVLVNLDYGTPGPYPAIIEARAQSLDGDAAVAKATTSALAALRSIAHDVVIVEPIPLPRLPRDTFDPLACLQKTAVLERCRYVARARPSALESLYRSVARRDRNVHSLSLDHDVCPFFPSCDPVVNGQVVKWDPSHLTPKFARTLVPTVDVYLRRAGVIPR